MERKIGEIINYNNVKLQIINSNKYCNGCYFLADCFECVKPDSFEPCTNRKDTKEVIFKEVKL